MKESNINTIFLTIGMIIGAMVVGFGMNADWKHESIQHGFAHYNETNGAWEWRKMEIIHHIPNLTNDFSIDANGGIWIKQEAK